MSICCEYGLPIVKKYFIEAENEKGEKVQLSVSEDIFQKIQQVMKEHPENKLIVKDSK